MLKSLTGDASWPATRDDLRRLAWILGLVWLALAAFTGLAQRYLGWRLAVGLIGGAGALFTIGLVLVAAGSLAAGSFERRWTARRERSSSGVTPTLSTEARRRAKANAQAAIDAASHALARGVIDESAWQQRVTGALAAAYLADDDPRWQSGFDGDAAAWRQARELILEGVSRDGTFLDVGCATGHLMECLAAWALERGRHLTMYGLELNRDLASAARRRLPAWADRIHLGNAVDWEPPIRFTYVRTGLEYVPAGRRTFLVARLLGDLVEPGGRLIVGPVSDSEVGDAVATLAATGFASPVVREATDRAGKTRYIVYVERGG